MFYNWLVVMWCGMIWLVRWDGIFWSKPTVKEAETSCHSVNKNLHPILFCYVQNKEDACSNLYPITVDASSRRLNIIKTYTSSKTTSRVIIKICLLDHTKALRSVFSAQRLVID